MVSEWVLTPTWNTFGLNNIIQTSFHPILLIEEAWRNLTLALGWYPMLLRPVIRIQPTPLLESTLALMRCYHQLPLIKWETDDRLDLHQDVEWSNPSRRAKVQ